MACVAARELFSPAASGSSSASGSSIAKRNPTSSSIACSHSPMMSVCSARSTMPSTGACWATSRRHSRILHWRTRPLHSPANGSLNRIPPASNDCDATSSVGEGLYFNGTLAPNPSTGHLNPQTHDPVKETLPPVKRVPSATYRLQLHKGFTFDDAAAIADYVRALGVSHVYCSPYLQAAPGSTHGYDIVDHHKVNDELGGAQEHEQFSLRLGACGLGQVLDIVPNHMAISGRRNRLWWDVLENGPSSRYSIYFDIDWQPHKERLRNKLLVPILGDHYGKALARGEIELKRRGG